MKVKALRGVCIGVDRHLKVDDTADLDPGTVTFLVSIGAVAVVKHEPPVVKAEPPQVKSAPEKSGSKEK